MRRAVPALWICLAACAAGGGDVPPAPDVPVLPPETLRVGVAARRLPVPLGIGTAGFGQEGGARSRYAVNYPATSGIYTHPSAAAVAVESGADRVVFLRLDLVGVTQQARSALLARILEKGGPDLDQALVVAATHTHSGPGRLVDHALWVFLSDVFFPAFFDRMIDAMADVVLAALDDLEPARFGYAIAETDALHDDRRCQSPFLLDGRMPILRFDRKDGTHKAIVVMYSVHGTVIGADMRLLSRDFHGGMEQKIAEQLDHPATVLFFNSWSGDTRPRQGEGDESTPEQDELTGIEAAGNTAAAVVMEALQGIVTSDVAIVRSTVQRIRLDRESLGYTGDEFPYERGGIYCGGGAEGACWGEPPPDPEDLRSGCLAFPEAAPGPGSTAIGLVRLGDLHIATLPGEPVTRIGLDTLDGVRAAAGAKDVAVLGYAQDYIGYSLPEDDWYRGGYEPSLCPWGPRQGPYLVAKAADLAEAVARGDPIADEAEATPAPVFQAAPFEAEPSASPAAVALEPPASVAAGDLVTAVIHGGDPWLVAPVVVLEEPSADGAFTAVKRRNGTPVSSEDGYEFELHLDVDPSYETDLGPVARTFAWTIRFPTRRGAPSTTKALDGGIYRLRVTGWLSEDEPFDLTTAPFAIE